MMTKYVIFSDDNKAIHQGEAAFDLEQRRDGLHVTASIKFEADARVTVADIEIDIGNRTYRKNNPDGPVVLRHGDTYSWSVDVHLRETS